MARKRLGMPDKFGSHTATVGGYVLEGHVPAVEVKKLLARFSRNGGRHPPRPIQGLSHVRPAWAHSCGCKSRRKLITANEAKRNCMRVTECGEEAWSEAAGR